jgi:hypothetical protein
MARRDNNDRSPGMGQGAGLCDVQGVATGSDECSRRRSTSRHRARCASAGFADIECNQRDDGGDEQEDRVHRSLLSESSSLLLIVERGWSKSTRLASAGQRQSGSHPEFVVTCVEEKIVLPSPLTHRTDAILVERKACAVWGARPHSKRAYASARAMLASPLPRGSRAAVASCAYGFLC